MVMATTVVAAATATVTVTHRPALVDVLLRHVVTTSLLTLLEGVAVLVVAEDHGHGLDLVGLFLRVARRRNLGGLYGGVGGGVGVGGIYSGVDGVRVDGAGGIGSGGSGGSGGGTGRAVLALKVPWTLAQASPPPSSPPPSSPPPWASQAPVPSPLAAAATAEGQAPHPTHHLPF